MIGLEILNKRFLQVVAEEFWQIVLNLPPRKCKTKAASFVTLLNLDSLGDLGDLDRMVIYKIENLWWEF